MSKILKSLALAACTATLCVTMTGCEAVKGAATSEKPVRTVYVYAPNFTIYGSMNAEDLRSIMDEGYEKFCEYVERYEREKRRTQYGT